MRISENIVPLMATLPTVPDVTALLVLQMKVPLPSIRVVNGISFPSIDEDFLERLLHLNHVTPCASSTDEDPPPMMLRGPDDFEYRLQYLGIRPRLGFLCQDIFPEPAPLDRIFEPNAGWIEHLPLDRF
jgi:hypothetical protein